MRKKYDILFINIIIFSRSLIKKDIKVRLNGYNYKKGRPDK